MPFLPFTDENTGALWVQGHGNSLGWTRAVLSPEPSPFRHPSSGPCWSESVIPLESFAGSRPSLLWQTQSVLLFTTSRSFFNLHDCSPSGDRVPSHLVFYVHWALVTFTQVHTIPFVFPLAFLPALNKKLCTNQRARKLSWPVGYTLCFYVESMNCPWRFALSFSPRSPHSWSDPARGLASWEDPRF